MSEGGLNSDIGLARLDIREQQTSLETALIEQGDLKCIPSSFAAPSKSATHFPFLIGIFTQHLNARRILVLIKLRMNIRPNKCLLN